MNELSELPSPPPGFPNYYWDPTDFDGPQLSRLRLGRIIVQDSYTYVYERVLDSRYMKPHLKTFLLVELGGIEGALFESITGFGIEPTDFNHDRYRAILRSGSLYRWWSGQGSQPPARWLYTAVDGRFMGIDYTPLSGWADFSS